MSEKIRKLLAGEGGNYILPFFWQHGEDEETLRTYMRVIQEANIGAVCVESRPHPDFAGPKWWQDMDVILDEARKRNMKVWILDDSHFPTGYANGAVKNAPTELHRQSVCASSIQLDGEARQVDISLEGMIPPQYACINMMEQYMMPVLLKDAPHFDDDQALAITAVSETGETVFIPYAGEKTLRWLKPDGKWTVWVIGLSRNCGVHREYINMLDPDSCRLLIDAVYEPHWQHYADDFGKTIAGFFSDEPELGNGHLYYYDNLLGTDQDLPFARTMPSELEKRLGKDWANRLYLLWDNGSDTKETAFVRYAYMDARQNNPYWLLKQNHDMNKDDRVNASFQGLLDIYDGLTFQARFNFDHDKYQEEGFRYASTFSPASMYDFGTYNKRRNNSTEMYVDYLLNYNKTFWEDWSVSGSVGWVGHTVKGYNYGTYLANATYVDGLNQKLMTEVNRFDVAYGGTGVSSENRTSDWDRSWLATAQAGWKERIYVDASWRRDQYRVFKQFPWADQACNYFGLGANALLTELIKFPKWWNYAKYRISYTQAGNAIPSRLYYGVSSSSSTGATSATFNSVQGAKPEQNYSFETGLEMLFLDNRLSFDVTYYHAKVPDLYMGISNTAGLTVYDNSATLLNQGFEATLAYNFRFGRDVRWRTAVNTSFNKNKVLTVGTDDLGRQKQVYTDVAGIRVRYLEGDAFGDMYVRDIRHNEDGTIFLSSNGNIMKEGRYTKYIGNMNSKWQLGWSNTINFKDFQLSFLINGRIGGKVISLTEAFLDEMGLSQRTADARDYAYANNLFTADGEPAMYLPDGSGQIIGVRNYYQVMGARGSQYSPLYVYDATNFRLRELSLAYTFRNVFGNGKDIGVSFIARNLFFLYKDAPVDPDVSLSTGNGLTGFELFNTPATRSFGFNVKMNF